MSTKCLTAAEQAQIRLDITQKLNDINSKMNEKGIRDARDKFIEKFILCETAYKIVLKKYLQINKRYKSDGEMKIQLTQVKFALLSAGYTVDIGLLDRLFSGSGKYRNQGDKSARLLRNGIEHEMNVKDLQEVKDRQVSLHNDMDTFLSLLKV